MTLVNRVSAFFLAALAICLAGYSLGSYLLIRTHLYDEFDRQLHSSLNVLVAAVEVEPDGVKWQPSDHTITLGDEGDADEVRWVLIDERGRVIDQSRNLKNDRAAEGSLLEVTRTLPPQEEVFEADQWRLLHRQLSAPEPKVADERDADEFAGVTVVAARNPARLRAELFGLMLLVSLLPAGLWCVAAILGRAYCQRALEPVRTMASRARSIKPGDFQARMAGPSLRDELGDLAEAFNGLLDQLQQAFDRQQRFTGDAAHQLRTPLTVLRGQIEVAMRRPRAETEYRELLATLRDETQSLDRIVETLLFLARADGDCEPPSAESLELADWLPAYMDRWKSHPRASDLHYENAPRATVVASSDLLAQALDNLIDNALKYSPVGTPVRMDVRVEPESVLIAIEDRGPGVSAADRERLFTPFFRSAQARKAGVQGTGLGLALVARIAKSLGGTVACETPSGAGACFIFTLPMGQNADRIRLGTASPSVDVVTRRRCMMIDHSAMVLRMAAATVLGGAIGWDRERQGRPAGLRTHLLVSIASATFMLVSTQFVYFQKYAAGDLVEIDASRIAASVVSGIGFLGAGAILRSGLGVQGLTTAASLWLVSAIGLASGGGMYVEAIVATAISLFCLVVLRRVEGRKGRLVVRRISLTIGDGGAHTSEVLAMLQREGAEVAAVDYDRRLKANKTSVMIDVRLKSDSEMEQLVRTLEAIPGTTRIKIQRPI